MNHNKEKHIEPTESTVLSTRYQSFVFLLFSLAEPFILLFPPPIVPAAPESRTLQDSSIESRDFHHGPSFPLGQPIRSVHRLGAIGRF